MNPSVIPKASELGDGVILEIDKHGGHVGFITGGLPMRPDYWLDKRVLSFFSGIEATTV
jgi:predicted alpha/beta-fold hydrolase